MAYYESMDSTGNFQQPSTMKKGLGIDTIISAHSYVKSNNTFLVHFKACVYFSRIFEAPLCRICFRWNAHKYSSSIWNVKNESPIVVTRKVNNN